MQGELYRARPIESYDVACFRGRFHSGTRFVGALVHATEEAMPFKLEVRATKGWARISHDGAQLEGSVMESFACTENTQDLLLKSHREFLEYAKGESSRVSTHLRDTRGYILATNALLASSGRIHDIAPDYIRSYRREDEQGFDVPGLRDAVLDSFINGRLFSEQGLAWAKAGAPVALDNFSKIALSDYR